MNHKSCRLMVILALAGAALATILPTGAQEAGMRPGGPTAAAVPAIVSPLVTDRMVTFRLRAPDAKSVSVSGDFGTDVALTRDAEGIWTATVGPLKPDGYVYYFIVDGVRLTDPSNPAGQDRLHHQHHHQPLQCAGRRAGVLRRAGRAARRDPHAAVQVQVEQGGARTQRLPAARLRREFAPAISGAVSAARLRQRPPLLASLRPRQRHPRQPAGKAGHQAIHRRDAAGLWWRIGQWRRHRHCAGQRRRIRRGFRALRARHSRRRHPADRRQVPHAGQSREPRHHGLLDGRDAGRPVRPRAPGYLQPCGHHERGPVGNPASAAAGPDPIARAGGQSRAGQQAAEAAVDRLRHRGHGDGRCPQYARGAAEGGHQAHLRRIRRRASLACVASGICATSRRCCFVEARWHCQLPAASRSPRPRPRSAPTPG